jgi:hypothetical protein
VAAELVGIVRRSAGENVHPTTQKYLASQTAESSYWPDDEEVSEELRKIPIYRKLSRSRLRMILEAIEDHARGYHPGGKQYSGMRVERNRFWIEHIMPQAWKSAWPAPAGVPPEDRDRRVQTIGNLTLLTDKLNTFISNAAWTICRIGEYRSDDLSTTTTPSGELWSDSVRWPN